MFINNQGDQFYLMRRKDTIQSLIIAPIFFSFFAWYFEMRVGGVSIRLMLILILPLFYTIVGFIYTPLFVRKKYVNNMVKSISITDNAISIETFKWFKSEPIKETALISDIEIGESEDIKFFRGKRVYLLNVKGFEPNPFYIVEDFFDDIEVVENLKK